MKPPLFPFAALVGLDTLKLALQLGAIDHRLSVLARGDKGAAKSTAARGLAELLDPAAPFVTLPIGATDDRLLGGLDLDKALKGEPALKRGVLADAHGGVLYVDEVNLLPDHLADAVLDAVASGVHVVEREGFSATQPADFVLIGTMNPEEGALRPQLLDRFALAVDVSAPVDPDERRLVIERRLGFDADPEAFAVEWREEGRRLSARVAEARARLTKVMLPGTMLDAIARRMVAERVRSLRADLAVVRGSRALAALEGADAVEPRHVDTVWPLALLHRVPPGSRAPQSPPPPQSSDGRERGDSGPEPDAESAPRSSDRAARVFPVGDAGVPTVIAEHVGRARGSSGSSHASQAGAPIGARQSPAPGELDARATVRHAVIRTGAAAIAREDLHERVRAPQAGTRFVFVVDSSGSHAVHDRMRFVKGAVRGLLESAVGRRDEIALIVCRGAAAQLLMAPTADVDAVDRAVEYLPTGGRTPLAHALDLAASLVTDATVAIVLTDGRANVPTRTGDAWADALAAAATLRCPAVVVDSEHGTDATGRPRLLAESIGASYVRLADLDAGAVVRIARSVS